MKRRRLSEPEDERDQAIEGGQPGKRPATLEADSAADFLARYSAGQFDPQSIPLQPREFVYQPDADNASELDPSGRTELAAGEITELPSSETMAESFIRYYRSHGFMPAPLSKHELNWSQSFEQCVRMPPLRLTHSNLSSSVTHGQPAAPEAASPEPLLGAQADLLWWSIGSPPWTRYQSTRALAFHSQRQ